MAMIKMVDMAMIRAAARCPWPESSAEVGERRQCLRTQVSLQEPTCQAGPVLLKTTPCEQWPCYWDTCWDLQIPKCLLSMRTQPHKFLWPSRVPWLVFVQLSPGCLPLVRLLWEAGMSAECTVGI